MRRACLAVLLAAAAFAAAAQPVNVTALIGAVILDPHGERLAVLRDLALNVRTGRVAYAILDARDPVASEEDLGAVPLDALRPGLARDRLVLEQPGRAAIGASPSAPDTRLLRATSIVGRAIHHPTGSDYGRIRDVVVDLDTASIEHVIVQLQSGTGELEREVPFEALRFPKGGGPALLTLDR